MEHIAIQQTDQYFTKFKNDIQKKTIELGFNETDKINELLEYIFEYDKFAFSPDLFLNKKSKTNRSSTNASTQSSTQLSHQTVSKSQPLPPPLPCDDERCIASRKQGDRCTRKRTKGQMYCGTHCMKQSQQGRGTNIPTDNGGDENTTEKAVEVVAQEIQGIIYYLDAECNVYNTEDIFKNINNPRIIAKAVRLGNDSFSIPSLGI